MHSVSCLKAAHRTGGSRFDCGWKIDQASGDQLPHHGRQAAVDLAMQPNTVTRAYREMEIRGLLETQQGPAHYRGAADRNTTPSSKSSVRTTCHRDDCQGIANGFTLTKNLIDALKAHGSSQKCQGGDNRCASISRLADLEKQSWSFV